MNSNIKEFENLSVKKKTLSTALGFEPWSFDCRFSTERFSNSLILLKIIEFWIFNSIFLNLKEKYTSYEKMLQFKLVDLYIVSRIHDSYVIYYNHIKLSCYYII